MKILSVNAGSSSLKFTLFEMPEEKELISGVFERIGIDNSFYTIKFNGEKVKKEIELKDHKAAFELLVKELIDNKIVESLEEIGGIGHRMVQGGTNFNKTALVTEENISIVEKYSVLAPLHNPAAIVGIRAAQSVFKDAIQTMVFDTAFHQTMEEEVYLY
ncbi:MAG: acetate kinase, partial [Bacilli bacterium]|nr:acetate kinase [Bacilli bacterium]